jgi:RNA polymerase sigma-70 factor (ECF subfamily)
MKMAMTGAGNQMDRGLGMLICRAGQAGGRENHEIPAAGDLVPPCRLPRPGHSGDSRIFALLYIHRGPCSLRPLLTTPISMFRQPRPPDPDQDLVTRAQQGDTRAFDALILKYGDKLYGLVYNMTSHKEDTHDLLQEIFARAYQSLGKFKGNAAFYTWIYQIAVNLTLNFLKKRKRRSSLSLNDMESSVQQDPALIDTAHEANPEKQTNLNELQVKLNEAMRKLSDPHRMVVTMFDIQGMSHGEIAKVLNTSEGTIRSRLHYAHLQLQSALQDSWEERF